MWNVPFCCFFFFFNLFQIWYSCVSVRAQHSIPVFKISLFVGPVWQERVKAEKSIGTKIWGSTEVEKWKQRRNGARQRREFKWDILRGCISSLTNLEVAPQEPRGLFRCLKCRNYFKGERGWLDEAGGKGNVLSHGEQKHCSGGRAGSWAHTGVLQSTDSLPEESQVI